MLCYNCFLSGICSNIYNIYIINLKHDRYYCRTNIETCYNRTQFYKQIQNFAIATLELIFAQNCGIRKPIYMETHERYHKCNLEQP